MQASVRKKFTGEITYKNIKLKKEGVTDELSK